MTSTTSRTSGHRFREPLRSPTFTLLVSGQVVSQVGDAAFRIALIVWVIQITGSSAALGVITAAFMVPNLLTFLVSGLVADRLPRRLVMLGSDFVRTALTVLLAVLATTSAHPPLAVLAVVYALFGIADAFFQPAYRANIPQLLPAEQLYPANALDMMGRRVGLIIGPMLSSSLIAGVGVAAAFWLDAATFAVSVGTLLLVEARVRRARPAAPDGAPAVSDPQEAERSAGARALLAEAGAGVRHLWRVRWLGVLILAAAIVNAGAAGGMDVVLPFFVRDGWGQHSSLLGVCYAVQAAGAVLGAFLVGRWGARRPGLAATAFLVLMGLSVAGLALGYLLPLVLPLALLYGLAVEAFGVHWSTLLQLHVPERILGRVSAADYLVSYSLMPLAVLACGAGLSSLAPRPLFAVVGLVMAAAAAVPFLFRPVRTLTDQAPDSAPDKDPAPGPGAAPDSGAAPVAVPAPTTPDAAAAERADRREQ